MNYNTLAAIQLSVLGTKYLQRAELWNYSSIGDSYFQISYKDDPLN